MRGLLRSPSGRVTNLTLLVALLLAVATGFGAVATGSARGRWVVIAHGIAAVAVVLLIPWKTRVVRAGLRQKRPSSRVHAGGGRADCKSRRLGYGLSRWVSLLLAALAVTTLVFGIGYTTGLVRSVGDFA